MKDFIVDLFSSTGHSDLDNYNRKYNGTTLSREPSTHRHPPTVRHRDSGEERLSRFTEYRGEDVQEKSRKSSLTDQTGSDRERGRSLPPG